MKRISLAGSNARGQCAFAFFLSCIIASTIYGTYLLGFTHPLAVVFIAAFSLAFASMFLAPLFLLLYFFGRRGFWDVLAAAAIATGLFFFSDYKLCSDHLTATFNFVTICVDGTMTVAGWWSFGEYIAEGVLLGCLGAVIFWFLAPKQNQLAQ